MIEEYGTLSEKELLEEIVNDLKEQTEIDVAELDFVFDEGKLHIQGSVQTGEDLESLVGILDDHLDPTDYQLEIDLLEQPPEEVEEEFEEEPGPAAGSATEEEDLFEESLDTVEEEEEMELGDDEGGFDDEKW